MKKVISINFEATATKRRLAGLSTLVNLSLSVKLINGQVRWKKEEDATERWSKSLSTNVDSTLAHQAIDIPAR